jgi:quercetin dioxygenase-like cupin family protein
MTAHAAARCLRLIPQALALGLMIGTAHAVELNPAAVIYQLPAQIKWQDPLGVSGAKNAVLMGDPTKPGLYAVMVKWLPGNFSRPHFHPNDRFITVLKGTWWVGTGTKFDINETVPMPAGSFVTHFGKQIHWDGAKDEEAVLLIMGEGPATSTRVPFEEVK